MSGGWVRAGRRDIPSLGDFLRAREARCVGFAGRLLRDGGLRLPNPIRGGVWIRRGAGGIAAAVLCAPGGLVHPRYALPVDMDPGAGRDAGLGRLLGDRAWLPSSAIGPAADVRRFEASLGLKPIEGVRYRLMELPGARPAPDRAAPGRAAGTAVRRAGAGDLELLAPLQVAYELEEVVTPLHRFDAAGSRAGLTRSLGAQLVVIAEREGRAVGKAQTNARSFTLDQVGGVYVEPAFRGRGIGRLLMEALLGLIVAGEACANDAAADNVAQRVGISGATDPGTRARRGAVLFVKEGNGPALALYRGLGFVDLGPFLADYYLA